MRYKYVKFGYVLSTEVWLRDKDKHENCKCILPRKREQGPRLLNWVIVKSCPETPVKRVEFVNDGCHTLSFGVGGEVMLL
jgi:hypothetical protein